MPSPRAFTLRHLWIVLSLLLLLGLAGLSVIWATIHHPDLVAPILGNDRTEVFQIWCVQARLRVPSKDSDGDGFPNWFEAFNHDDPNIAAEHPPLVALPADSRTGFYVGERTRLQWKWDNSPYTHWPAGFQASVSADAPVILAAGENSPPSTGPILLEASPAGYLEFDVLASASGRTIHFAFSHLKPQAEVFFEGPHLEVYGRRLPPLPAAFRPAEGSIQMDMNGTEVLQMHIVSWNSLPSHDLLYVIERARAGHSGEWTPVGIAPEQVAAGREIPFGRPALSKKSKIPVVYRVVPVRMGSGNTPPAK